jgi:hypothetical protein
MRRLQG